MLEQEPEKCLRCGHFESKHKIGLCVGHYYQRADNGRGDTIVFCDCKGFEE